MTAPIKSGDTIKINYTGRYENGELFDTSKGGEPLTFTVGGGQLARGLDNAVVGMSQGDSKTVNVDFTEDYGERDEEKILDLPISTIPNGMQVEIGMQIELADDNRNPVPATVVEVLTDVVKMDVNHPLAGKTLIFDIEIVETGLTPDP